jgi:ribulose kinase
MFPTAVKGLGFGATYSFTVSDFDGNLITMTKSSCFGNHGDRNIILWADHRAEKEAEPTPLGRLS